MRARYSDGKTGEWSPAYAFQTMKEAKRALDVEKITDEQNPKPVEWEYRIDKTHLY